MEDDFLVQALIYLSLAVMALSSTWLSKVLAQTYVPKKQARWVQITLNLLVASVITNVSIMIYVLFKV